MRCPLAAHSLLGARSSPSRHVLRVPLCKLATADSLEAPRRRNDAYLPQYMRCSSLTGRTHAAARSLLGAHSPLSRHIPRVPLCKLATADSLQAPRRRNVAYLLQYITCSLTGRTHAAACSLLGARSSLSIDGVFVPAPRQISYCAHMDGKDTKAALEAVIAALEAATEALHKLRGDASSDRSSTGLALRPPSPASPATPASPHAAIAHAAAPLVTLPRVVLALFDYTTLGLEPWRRRGYECHAYDLRHPKGHTVTADGIHLHGCDLSALDAPSAVVAAHADRDVAFAMAYPPCTDLSRAGARYWKAKAAARPAFQTDAAGLVRRVDAALSQLECPYFVENPAASKLRDLWRPPDFAFEPYWYGGWLRADDAHPRCPAHVPLQDAYTKRTGLWTGGGFGALPPQRRVVPTFKEWIEPQTGKKRKISPPMFSGGAEGKEARLCTPRGFAEAVAATYACGAM